MPAYPLVTPNPSILSNPGFLLVAPLASTLPANTVAGGIFTDAWPAAWVHVGATSEGSEFSYGTSVEGVEVAEFAGAIKYETTEATGSWSFSMASYTASTLKLAYNGGVGAITPTSGTGATSLYTVEPPELGSEVRIMVGWESSDRTVRRVAYQTIQGGEAATAHRKAPDLALVPVTFNIERPIVGSASSKPFTTWLAGAARG